MADKPDTSWESDWFHAYDLHFLLYGANLAIFWYVLRTYDWNAVWCVMASYALGWFTLAFSQYRKGRDAHLREGDDG